MDNDICKQASASAGVMCYGQPFTEGNGANGKGNPVQLCYNVGVDSGNKDGWLISKGNMKTDQRVNTLCSKAPACAEVGTKCSLKNVSVL